MTAQFTQDQWATVDAEIVTCHILLAIKRIREFAGVGIKEAIDIHFERYNKLRAERPGDLPARTTSTGKVFTREGCRPGGPIHMTSQADSKVAAGLRALRNFLRMLNEAAASCRMSMEWRCSQEGMGVLLDGQYWLGLSFDEPDQLCFQVDAPVSSGTPPWRHTARLGSAEVQFYSRSAVEQMRWLETFLREYLEKARCLPLPDRIV